MIWMKRVWLLLLTVAAWEDARKREVSYELILVGFLPGIWNLSQSGLPAYLWAATAGIFMLILSWITGGALGEGDGLFFLMSACYLDVQDIWLLFLGSLGLASAWGVAFLLYGRWSGKLEIVSNTIPFLTCTWPVGVWLVLK